MKGVMVKLEKWFDIYIIYFSYYMRSKYGKNYERL